MGRSFLYDWGTGIGTNIIGAVLIAIMWKYIKAVLNNILRGQPENPAMPIPPSHDLEGGFCHGQEGIEQSVLHNKSSSPPRSQLVLHNQPSITPTSIPPGHGQEGIEQSVLHNTSSSPSNRRKIRSRNTDNLLDGCNFVLRREHTEP